MKLTTSWYPAEVKPVRVGWYELYRWRYDRGGCGRAYWTGSEWSYYDFGVMSCAPDRWRGRSKP